MNRFSLLRSLTLAGVFASSISLAGVALAASPPSSSHASSTAVSAVSKAAPSTNENTELDENSEDTPGQDVHALAVSTAANSDTVGGAQQNHGGYVSCVARGGSGCTSTTPTLPSHGEASTHIPTNLPTR